MEYSGLEIAIGEGVYEPAEDSFLAAEVVSRCITEMHSSLSVADIGTGTGLLGLVAALDSRCSRVAFCDVNYDAVELARNNFAKNRGKLYAKASFLRSDLLEGVHGLFDLIIFNAPYLRSENPGEDRRSDWAGGAEGVELSIDFLGQANLKLADGGRIVLTSSSLSNRPMLNDWIRKEALQILGERKIHLFFEDISCLVIGRSGPLGVHQLH